MLTKCVPNLKSLEKVFPLLMLGESARFHDGTCRWYPVRVLTIYSISERPFFMKASLFEFDLAGPMEM